MVAKCPGSGNPAAHACSIRGDTFAAILPRQNKEVTLQTRIRIATCFTAATLALPGLACAQQAAPAKPPAADKPPVFVPANQAPAKTELAKLLEANVRAAWDAFKRKDKDAYAKFLTDDFQAVESDGDGERPRFKVLREVEHCLYTDYLLQFFLVQPLDPDHAFVTYESTMKFPKNSVLRMRRVFVSELWIRNNGQWKMMRYQETVVR